MFTYDVTEGGGAKARCTAFTFGERLQQQIARGSFAFAPPPFRDVICKQRDHGNGDERRLAGPDCPYDRPFATISYRQAHPVTFYLISFCNFVALHRVQQYY